MRITVISFRQAPSSSTILGVYHSLTYLSIAFISCGATLHNSTVYPDPHHFNPNCFMATGTKNNTASESLPAVAHIPGPAKSTPLPMRGRKGMQLRFLPSRKVSLLHGQSERSRCNLSTQLTSLIFEKRGRFTTRLDFFELVLIRPIKQRCKPIEQLLVGRIFNGHCFAKINWQTHSCSL